MTIYKLSRYAEGSYGEPLYLTFSADPMVVTQVAHGQLQIEWATPAQTQTSVVLAGARGWTRIRLVRNAFGVPDAEDDGLVCAEATAAQGLNTYLDAGCVPGRLYYYGVWVASTPGVYDAALVYQAGDLVTQPAGGPVYQCMLPNTSGGSGSTGPGLDTRAWDPVPLTAQWYRAGAVCGLAVRDAGHAQLLYDLTPRPYKVQVVETTATEIAVNDFLARFLAIFGFHLDVLKSEHDRMLLMNDVLECSDHQVTLIAEQLGVADRLPMRPELRRTYVARAVEIQRLRGSVRGAAELVRALTGWDSVVEVGHNVLPDMDTGAFASPAPTPWNSRALYTSSTVTGEGSLVRQGFNTFTSKGPIQRQAAFKLAASSVAGGTYQSTVWDRSTSVGGYAMLTAAVVGGTFTHTFAAPADIGTRGGAGTYLIWVTCLRREDAGIVTVKVNGTTVLDGAGAALRIDLYAPAQDESARIALGSFALTATGNTITYTCVDRNALSAGANVTSMSWAMGRTGVVGGSDTGVGVQPPNSSVDDASYWRYVPRGTVVDGRAMRNAETDGFGAWSMVVAAATNPQPDNARGAGVAAQWGVLIEGADVPGVGTDADLTWPGNALIHTPPAGAAVFTDEISTVGSLYTPTWDASTRFLPGQLCSAASADIPGTTLIYRARVASRGAVPAASPSAWERTSLVARDPDADPEIVAKYCVPLARTRRWLPLVSYARRDRVGLRGHLYEAALVTQGQAPTGHQGDNLWWRWLGPDRQAYTWSIHHSRTTAPVAGQQVIAFLGWFDEVGKTLRYTYPAFGAPAMLDRFEIDDTLYPVAGTSAPVGYTAPHAQEHGTALPWGTTRGSWSTRRGMVHPTAWMTPTSDITLDVAQKIGRFLSYGRTWVYPTGTTTTLYVTLGSAPEVPTWEQGIIFRGSTVGYWMASRSRLTYTTINKTGSVFTGRTIVGAATVAYSTATTVPVPLQDGTRLRVEVSSTSITVRALHGSSLGVWQVLATSSRTDNASGVEVGVGERNPL